MLKAAASTRPRFALAVLVLLAGLALATVAVAGHPLAPDRSVAAAALATDVGAEGVTVRGDRAAVVVSAPGQLALPVQAPAAPAVAAVTLPAPDEPEQAGVVPVDAPTGRAPPTSIG